MSPRFFSAASLAAMSLAVLASCGKKQEPEKPGPEVDPVKKIEVNLTAGSTEFDENGEATLSLTLSEASDQEVTVKIAVSPDVQSGFTAVDASKIVIDNSTVAIPAGSKTASVKVAVKLDEVEDGQQAAFTISSATGAEVGKDAKVCIKVNKPAPPEPPAPLPTNLDWTVRYVGCDWVEGDLDAGQQEFFEVITSDKAQLYFYFLYDMSVESEKNTIAFLKSNPQDFIQAFQNQVDEGIDGVWEEYSYWFDSREEVVNYLAYNELKDGTIVYYDGQKAGDYVFLVITLSAQGVLDGGYSYIEFSKDTDAEAHYDYGIQATLREDWTIECVGRVDSPFYEVLVQGMAPGASHLYAIPFQSEEEMLDRFGNVGNAIGSEIANIQSGFEYYQDMYTYEEYMSKITDPVAEDGSFTMNVYPSPDESWLYLFFGLDENYNFLPGYAYGKGVLVFPSRDADPIETEDPEHLDDSEWTDRTDWDIYFDPEADTGSEYYNQAVVVTACDADYFIVHIGEPGEMEKLGIARIGQDEYERLQKNFNYFSLEQMLEFGFLYSSAYLPCVQAAKDLVDGVEMTIIGFDADFNLTKEYHTDTVVDAGPAAAAPARRSGDVRPCPKIDKPVIIR